MLFRSPWRRRLAGCSVVVAQDQATPFLRLADIEHAVESGAGDVDRALDPVRAAAAYELGHGCGSLDGDEGRDLAKQPARSAGRGRADRGTRGAYRSEEHTSELQSLMRISYAVFCLKKKKTTTNKHTK